MKMFVLGWIRRSGIAKVGGRAFDFAQLIGTAEIETVSGEKYSQVGAGFQQMEIPLQNGCEGEFKGLKFPGVYELKMDHRLGARGQIEPVCVGVVKAAAAAA